MKKQVVAVAALAGLALGAVIAQGAETRSNGNGIVGSVHDLNSGTFSVGVSDPGKRVCAFCHSPHHSLNDNSEASAEVANLGGTGTAASYKVYAPLWSRTDLNDITGYGTYISQTFNPGAQDKAYDPLIGPSRLCLTCHDGNIALDAYYGNAAADQAEYTSGDAFNGPMGGNGIGIATGMVGLTNDHPIGMKYADFLDKSDKNGTKYELMPVATKFVDTDNLTTGTKSIASVLYSDPGDTNVSGFVTCASCHDVHNGTAVGNKLPAGGMRGFLLYGSQVNSSFCLTCHDKNNGVVPAGK